MAYYRELFVCNPKPFGKVGTISDFGTVIGGSTPSKAKAEQITCIDKARLVHKIGELTPDFMKRLEKRILKNLDIK